MLTIRPIPWNVAEQNHPFTVWVNETRLNYPVCSLVSAETRADMIACGTAMPMVVRVKDREGQTVYAISNKATLDTP